MKYSQEMLDLFNSKEVQQRFWTKVDKTKDCWEWVAAKDRDGYGRFYLSGINHTAHVLSLWSHLNEASGGRCVCHTCDNPPCVNPNHLWYGTHSDNTKDAFAKGRMGVFRIKAREQVGGCYKITEDQAIEILRIKRETGKMPRDIQKMFPNIGLNIIRHLIYNQTWKHLPRS